jgi:peptidoglycan/LPS O-acetylase OafA/YrhL
VSPVLSLHLDAIRFLAAIVVLLSHWAYPRFTEGDYIVIRELNLGSDAVVVFFVLSGLVVAHAAATKDRTLGQFAFHRATRIYSVAVPVLILTQVFDLLGRTLDPVAYEGWWHSSASGGKQIFDALTFTSQSWLNNTRIGTNGPYWSLAYEVWYYVAFACLFYLRGVARVAWTVLACLIAGPKILLLAPIWWLGVWAYRHLAIAQALGQPAAWTLTLAPFGIYVICQAIGLPRALLSGTKALLGEAFVVHGLGFSDEFLWNLIVGVLVTAHFLGVAGSTAAAARPGGRWTVWVKWLAGASFSLYLLHYPTLQLLEALLPGFAVPQLRHTLLLGLSLAICFAFASVFERRLNLWRRVLVGAVVTLRDHRPQLRVR